MPLHVVGGIHGDWSALLSIVRSLKPGDEVIQVGRILSPQPSRRGENAKIINWLSETLPTCDTWIQLGGDTEKPDRNPALCQGSARNLEWLWSRGYVRSAVAVTDGPLNESLLVTPSALSRSAWASLGSPSTAFDAATAILLTPTLLDVPTVQEPGHFEPPFATAHGTQKGDIRVGGRGALVLGARRHLGGGVPVYSTEAEALV